MDPRFSKGKNCMKMKENEPRGERLLAPLFGSTTLELTDFELFVTKLVVASNFLDLILIF